jgi:8-oxo-dGTP pyrophosphatase MutT (NUDIX family)
MVTRAPGEEVAPVNSPGAVRRSRIAYVVAKLRIQGQDYLLLNAHRKWGDWSLPGGHVEPQDADFWAAAVRETTEELEPLRYGEDLEVQREQLTCSEWGPVASTSAGGALTVYQAAFHVLRFKTDPKHCLERLPEGDFRLLRLRDVGTSTNVASVVRRLGDLLPGGLPSLPLSWNDDLDDAPLRPSASSHPVPAA